MCPTCTCVREMDAGNRWYRSLESHMHLNIQGESLPCRHAQYCHSYLYFKLSIWSRPQGLWWGHAPARCCYSTSLRELLRGLTSIIQLSKGGSFSVHLQDHLPQGRTCSTAPPGIWSPGPPPAATARCLKLPDSPTVQSNIKEGQNETYFYCWTEPKDWTKDSGGKTWVV